MVVPLLASENPSSGLSIGKSLNCETWTLKSH